jgi:hypothetical protein
MEIIFVVGGGERHNVIFPKNEDKVSHFMKN